MWNTWCHKYTRTKQCLRGEFSVGGIFQEWKILYFDIFTYSRLINIQLINHKMNLRDRNEN